jgi:hypothetical protein
MRLQKIRIYMNVANLFTFSKVKDYDPEGTDESGQFYPQLRTYNFGASIGF